MTRILTYATLTDLYYVTAGDTVILDTVYNPQARYISLRLWVCVEEYISIYYGDGL